MKRILVVDDNDANLYLLKSLLEEEGFAVIEAKNGQEALEQAHTEPPDLILSDILMPVMDGYLLCRKCKSDEQLRQIPFIFYTATYTDPKDEKFALSLGADRFVLKPQEPEVLLNLFKEVWEERAAAKPAEPKPLGEEMEFFRHYNDVLFKKLEKKMVDLEIAHQKLKCLEEQYRLSFENVTDIVWTVDADFTVRKMSPSVEKMLGYKPQEFLGRSFSDLVEILAPESRERAMAELLLVLKGQTIPASVYSLVAKDGTVKHGEISGAPILREGEIVGMVSVVRDITKRKQAEEKLRESEKKYRDLYDFLPIPVYEMDFEANIISANHAIYETFGGSEEDLKKEFNAWQLVSPEEMDKSRKNIERLLKGEKVGGTEYTLQRLDGSVFPAIVISSVIYSNDKPVGLRGAIVDITERKRADEEQEKLQAQLLQAQKMESVGRLAGGVAHDFNNMLGLILGHAELALEQADPTHPLYTNLQEIRKAAERSANLTRQLLAFARKQTIAPMALDLNETVTGMLKMLQRLIGEDIDLSWHPEADLWPIKMDPSQIDQILANLCINSRDAISGVGKMTIETANVTFDEEYCAAHTGFVPGEYVRLAVSDDGCGMDKETLSHLFEPFFTTKEIGKGTGLGLATIYGTVKQNNGFINVYSEPGQGTTFTIYLPRHLGKAEQARPKSTRKPALRGQETILLVEDEPDNLNLTTLLLERQGYTVLAASAPGEAIRLAQEHIGEIQLLMTDVVMPQMNGRDLANHLLALYPHLKRLFTSGYTADVIVHHGVLDEGVHFIQKPFSLQSLAAKVREVLDQT